jgi:transposase
MTWKPSYLTRDQLEERRLAGGHLLRAGPLSQAEIARQLNVSRAGVSVWAKTVDKAGLHGLRQRKAAGSQSKLTQAQKQKLKCLLDRGALACGFSTDRWTLECVAELIQHKFGVKYHPNYLNRLLAALGFSPQKPLARAAEQDEELVRAWLKQDWPRIKKGVATRRIDRVFR